MALINQWIIGTVEPNFGTGNIMAFISPIRSRQGETAIYDAVTSVMDELRWMGQGSRGWICGKFHPGRRVAASTVWQFQSSSGFPVPQLR